jgi:RNA polymerase sigma-70 factor (ECF subfamily)
VPEDNLARFEQLYREHVGALFAYALVRTPPELAEEAVEETFLVAWRRMSDLPDEPRPWLCGVARRVMANQRRARDRRGALDQRIIAWRAMALDGDDPAEQVTERSTAIAALGRLSERDRELLCLTAWCELTAEESARVLGCSKATLLMRLHRARRRFESALSTEDGHGHPTTTSKAQALSAPNLDIPEPLLSKETVP